MKFKKLCSILSLLLLFTALHFAAVSPVQACSGGGTDDIDSLLERTDIVVQAEPVMVDDVRQNGVLRVSSYLKGGAGPEYLLFVQNDPLIVERMLEGYPYGTCDFFSRDLIPGETGYFFLSRRMDGAYISTTYWQDPPYYTFPEVNSQIRFYSIEEDVFKEHLLTEAEIVDFIAQFSGETPTQPDTNSAYPRSAPLKITLEDARQYFLPVDRVEPIEVTDAVLNQMTVEILGYDAPFWNERYFIYSQCPGESCTQVTPDGVNRAWQRGEQISWYDGSAEGQAFLFSSTNDAIAVWNHNQLSIYTLGFTRHDQNIRDVTLLNMIVLAGEDKPVSYQAAWSPDGRLLAYSDANGLWLLDAYDSSRSPSLLLESEDENIPFALQFSSQGRYLLFQKGTVRATLDILSGMTLPDGIISPDERLLLAFDTQAEFFELELCYLAPLGECEPMRGTLAEYSPDDKQYFALFAEVEWIDNYDFLALVCAAEDRTACIVDRRFNERGDFWRDSVYWHEGSDFSYADNTLAVLQSDFVLRIDDAIYDLSEYLQSPVVDVQWLPSLFYTKPSS